MKKSKIEIRPGEKEQTDLNGQSLNTPEKMNKDPEKGSKIIFDELKQSGDRIGRSIVHTR